MMSGYIVRRSSASWLASLALLVIVPAAASAQDRFQIEEATIADMHNAIKSGQTACQAIVRAYIERAKAYNSTCTALVTLDGSPVPPATGAVRAGAPMKFPTSTVPVSSIFPDFQQ